MNRPLALYLLILDFFLVLIGGSELVVLQGQARLWRFDFMAALGSMFGCAACSVCYILSTRNSVPSPEPDTDLHVIDDFAGQAENRFQPIADWIKACGVVASVLALFVFLETIYGLLLLYREDLLGAELKMNSSLTVVFVVLFFNAFCQPWYVWRTFLNVNTGE